MINPSKILIQPYWSQRHSFYELAGKYGCGFELVSFAMPSVIDSKEQRKEQMSAFQQELRNFSGYKTFHGPFIDLVLHSPDKKIAKLSQDRIREGIEMALNLGCSHIVFHCSINMLIRNQSYFKKAVEDQADFWSAVSKEYPEICICLENMWEDSPDLLKDIIKKSNSEHVKSCLDLGHMNVFSSLDASRWFDTMKEDIVYMHWNDNDGDRDLELALGEGNIDWKKMVNFTSQLSEHPLIVLEVGDIVNVEKSFEYLKSRGYLKI